MKHIHLLFFLFPGVLIAQNKLTIDQFFELAMPEQTSTSTVDLSDPKFPLIEEYVFRTETRDLDFEQQEYTFRLSPSTPKIRKAQKELYEHINQGVPLDEEKLFCDQIQWVYRDWLSLYTINQNKNIIKDWESLLSDKRKVYDKLANSLDFDFEKLVRLEIAKSEIQIIKDEIEIDEQIIRKKYGIENAELDFTGFVSSDQIGIRLNELSNSNLAPIDEKAAYELESIARELALEEAEKKQYFDFAQVKYVGPHEDPFRERFSIGVGIKLPTSGNQKIKIRELEMKQNEIQKELNLDQEQQELKQKLATEKLQIRLQKFELYQSTIQKERSQLKNISALVSQKQGFNPLPIIEIEERYIKNQLKLLDKQTDLISSYLLFLEDSQLLCTAPFKNYLRSSRN